MNILLLSRYSRIGASSRLRTLQFLPLLKSDFQIDVQALFGDDYIKAIYSKSKPSLKTLAKSFFARLVLWKKIRDYDLLWVEKELFPWLPYGLEKFILLRNIPYVVDYDDAEFHKYDLHRSWLVRTLMGSKIDRVMRGASVVIAGNEYLAQRARAAGAKQVVMVPTVINMDRYPGSGSQSQQKIGKHPVVIGWVGSPATSHYLREVEDVLSRLSRKYEVQVAVIGCSVNPLKTVDVKLIKWTEDTEVSNISQFDIGIMPLVDSPWERGKCGYKLIQYMGCGIPVVASSVGANIDIVKHGENGFLASTAEDWYQFLEALILDESFRKDMGRKGAKIAHERFSVRSVFPQIKNALLKAGKENQNLVRDNISSVK